MNGIPYWGINTQEQLRTLYDRKPKQVTPQDLAVQDLYSLFRTLSREGYLFILEGKFASWCYDIRFNYRDREVFIPYYAYELHTTMARKPDLTNPQLDILDRDLETPYIGVRYEYEMRTRTVDDRTNNFRANDITVYHPKTGVYYRIPIKGLPYLTETAFSMLDLLQRHTNVKYTINEFDENSRWESYLAITKRGYSREKRLRYELNLQTYSDNYTDINYQDIRMYETGSFEPEYQYVSTTEDFKDRIYDFEAYLYCIFAQGIPPLESDYLQAFNHLGVTKRFITVHNPQKDNPHPLILKYYYTDKPHSFKKLTYERYR